MGATTEEPSLTLLRRVLIIVSISVAVLCIIALYSSKDVVQSKVHESTALSFEGLRGAMHEVCACCQKLSVANTGGGCTQAECVRTLKGLALRVTPVRSPWQAHVACVSRLRQGKSFPRMLLATVHPPSLVAKYLVFDCVYV